MMTIVFINTMIILLFLNNISFAAEGSSGFGTVLLNLILYIGVITLVLLMTIFGTRYVAKNTKRFVSSKYMKIVDVLNLGTNLKILMLQVKDYIYVIVVSNNSIEVVDKLPKDSIVHVEDFEEYLNRYAFSSKNKYLNNIYKNISRFSNRFNNIDDKEEVDHEKDK